MLSEKLKQARIDKGFSQEKVATKIKGWWEVKRYHRKRRNGDEDRKGRLQQEVRNVVYDCSYDYFLLDSFSRSGCFNRRICTYH